MIPSGVEVFVSVDPIDLRWGFDRLAGLVEERIGRKARSGALFVFFGSDDHAESAASFFSLLASARLHRLDPEAYIRDVLRVLPYWPKDRYLELAPKYWSATRARLSADELRDEVGPITVPPDAAASSEQKALAG